MQPKRSPRSDRFHKFQLTQLLIWLERYPDFFGKLSRGLINFEELGKPGPNSPLNPLNEAHIDAELAWQSHRKLERALMLLRKAHPWHYEIIERLYVSDNAQPGLRGKWEHLAEKENHRESQIKLNVRRLALRKLLDFIGDHRLVVPYPPHKGRGDKEEARNQRRIEGLRKYFERLDIMLEQGWDEKKASGQAVLEISAQFGVGSSTVYSWLASVDQEPE